MKTDPSRARLGGLALFALCATSVSAWGQSEYEDPQYGFKLVIPDDFHSVPINMAEKWVVAKFLYKRAFAPKTGEWYVERTPEIRVIVFPHVDVKDVVEARKGEWKKFAVKDDKGEISYVDLGAYLQNPFRSYQEFLRENYKKGGWFVAEEQDLTIGGLPAKYERIDVEEKMGSGQKSTIHAWEIDVDDATYVVQFEVLADYEHKFRADVSGAVAAFRAIPRTEALRPVLTSAGGSSEERRKEIEAFAKDEELSPKERRAAREEDLARAIERAEKAMEDGWSTYRHGPFTVFHSTPAKFARDVSKQAVLMWQWMDDNFGDVGEDDCVGNILRICRNRAEAQSYQDTSTRSDYSLTAREIVVWDDKDWGWGEMGSGKLNAAIAMQYLLDKNRRLWYGLPPWLEHGLVIYIGSLKMKGNRLVGRPDDWDMEAIRMRMREDAFRPARDVLKSGWDEYNASRADSADRVQSLAMVNFMFETRSKSYRDVLHDYILALDERLRAFEKEWSSSEIGAEDGDEAISKWLADWNKKRDAIYDQCFEDTFGSWNEKAWAVFDQAWRKAY